MCRFTHCCNKNIDYNHFKYPAREIFFFYSHWKTGAVEKMDAFNLDAESQRGDDL